MTLREAIAGLGDNPLYERERRLQRHGCGWIPIAVVASCAGVAFVVPCLLAPAFAAAAVLRDRRAGVWTDVVLTPLSADEVILAKLVPALRLPAILFVLGAVLATASGLLWSALGGSARAPDLAQAAWDLVLRAPAALVAGTSALVLAGLAGIRTGLSSRNGSAAVTRAYILFIGAEALAYLVAFRWLPLSAQAWYTPPTLASVSLAVDCLLHYGAFAACNLFLASRL